MRLPFVSRKTMDLAVRRAVSTAKKEQMQWVREILKNADKVVLEPMTVVPGEDGKTVIVGNHIFLTEGKSPAINIESPGRINGQMAES